MLYDFISGDVPFLGGGGVLIHFRVQFAWDFSACLGLKTS